MNKSESKILLFLSIVMAMTVLPGVLWGQVAGQIMLNPKTIPQFVDALPHFAGYRVAANNITVSAEEIQSKVLPAVLYPAAYTAGTWVWGYNVNGQGANYPGFSVEAKRGTPVTMTYLNNIPATGSKVQGYLTVDQTLHWADPLGQMGAMTPYTGPPPIAAHLHGAEVPSEFDGGPDQWFTIDGKRGPGFRSLAGLPVPLNGCVYQYPNDQDPTTLWFHDHALGATRLNVYAGLAAFYFLRDPEPANPLIPAIERADLPGGASDTTVTEPGRAIFANNVYKPEIELAIQDRMFDTNGQLYFPSVGLNPTIHPYWLPEFFGNVMVVNGKSWPFLNVEPRRYRFRVLDGCNARFLNMWLEPKNGSPNPVIWQIGSDGGMLSAPAKLSRLFLAPGERADIIIDFTGFAGQTLVLRNDAKAPFPKGTSPDPKTTGSIMQFRVGTALTGTADLSYNPAVDTTALRQQPIVPVVPTAAVVKRQLTLNEVMGAGGPQEVLVNNTKWSGKRIIGMDANGMHMMEAIPGFTPVIGNYLSELPAIGTTEIWEIINLTADAHPIHLHLVQFQLINRQPFNVNQFNKAYSAAFPGGYDFAMMMTMPAGVFIPAFGPPSAYSVANADGAVGGNPAIGPFLSKAISLPLPEETGWKDTIKVYPGEVTRIAVRFTQQNGGAFTFDATGLYSQAPFNVLGPVAVGPDGLTAAGGPGYVWHCHIIDHEDNEMMRPYIPVY